MFRTVLRCCRAAASPGEPAEIKTTEDVEQVEFWEHYDKREYDSYIFPPALLCQHICGPCRSVSDSSEEDSSTQADDEYFQIFPKRCRADQKHCWDAADGTGVVVRGPSYLSNRKKIDSQRPMLKLAGVRLFHASQRWDTIHKCSWPKDGKLMFLIHAQLPTLQLVAAWTAPKDSDWMESPEGLLFSRFVNRMTTEERNRHLKMIPRLIEGSFLARQTMPNNKPVLIARQCNVTYTHEPGYFEVSIDLGSSSIGNALNSLLQSGNSMFELFFLLEGQAPQELPERLLAGVTLCRVSTSLITKA
eukprot:TRINITY_DN57068_c0_g1_i1.p1 TRINITY_DN57068_c0_g1~~TRINITY_DN57068_c0_g1_i1.p1  ORF type:complete len:303 (+),score=29.97 TRINITY_DN57068_c0_g1_i1:71-979(+)